MPDQDKVEIVRNPTAGTIVEVVDELNGQYRELMYEGGAERRGFAVNPNAEEGKIAHRWYNAGVEAAYLALRNREDVPDAVKNAIALYCGTKTK